MAAKTLIIAERLRELMSYDPETGFFRWLVSRGPVKAGSAAGTLLSGYIHIQIEGRQYFAQRLAWLYMTGKWPARFIDHRDTVKTNNIWTNLREANDVQNQGNMKIPLRNTSGYKGVTWHKGKRRWQASITMFGRYKYLGRFKCPVAAHLAYLLAAAKHFGEFARAA